ncbi:MAG TPA: F0F1 ATP synthase subunit A [Bacillota bacterium]|jgi:F-type H+-transporting ATPase subunit a|nr:F0F1 ATP synthase subunit A [Bacillota bacterium]
MIELTYFENLSPQVISTLIVIGVLALVFILVGIKVKKLDPHKTPKGFILLCLLLVEMFNKLARGYVKEKPFRFFAPYLFTIIVFLALANTISLFGLTPPLSNLGVALSFSILTFIVIKIAEFKYIGVIKKIDGLLGPVKPIAFLMLPINLIGEISTPFSMGLRLFVNVMGGTVIAAMVYTILHWTAGIFAGVLLHAVFDIFFGLIQAFVFFMLSTVSISMATDA